MPKGNKEGPPKTARGPKTGQGGGQGNHSGNSTGTGPRTGGQREAYKPIKKGG